MPFAIKELRKQGFKDHPEHIALAKAGQVQACDYSLARPFVPALQQAGIWGSLRYAYDGTMVGKGITKSEWDMLVANKQACALISETGTQPALRGGPGGVADAQAFLDAVGSFYPVNAAHYFCAEDPNRLDPSQWPTVVAYFQKVRTIIVNSPIGAYGSAALVQHLMALGLAQFGWIVGPWGVTDPTLPAIHIIQIIGGVPSQFSGQIDMDPLAQAYWGQPQTNPKPKETEMYLIRNSAGMVCTFSGTHKRLVPSPTIMALYTAVGAPVVQLPDAEFSAIPDGDTTSAIENWLRQEFSAPGQELHDRIVQATTQAIGQSGVVLQNNAAAAIKANVPAAVLTALSQHDPTEVNDVLAAIKQSLPSLQGPQGVPGPAGPSGTDTVAQAKIAADEAKMAQVAKDLESPPAT